MQINLILFANTFKYYFTSSKSISQPQKKYNVLQRLFKKVRAFFVISWCLLLTNKKRKKIMSKPKENEAKQPVEAEDLYSIQISMNVKEVVKEVAAHKGRTIMIALDGTEYSEIAAKWVHDNLARKDDFIVLVRYAKTTFISICSPFFFLNEHSQKKKSIWEEAMVEKLFTELDAEIIHPEVDVTKSKHNQLNDTFEKAKILRDHPNVKKNFSKKKRYCHLKDCVFCNSCMHC
ncbi:hypothetical protein RFI_15461 [Reticulomyxa filosa]|uniref:UspA domain-containing protein n=1 Tax=Reticulomyxa filosa TaxID=46433 RepID=X6N6R3_RETFI|nr:hypothetical protein RFI_15461 [Reticulomyxa filosa]|eukprot:ETO21741.1 hypothetical protein RFI_15461 [Reticulomyxa filosa]